MKLLLAKLIRAAFTKRNGICPSDIAFEKLVQQHFYADIPQQSPKIEKTRYKSLIDIGVILCEDAKKWTRSASLHTT